MSIISEKQNVMENTKKIVLITGGTRGIGRHTCLKMAERGYQVLLTYRSNQEMAEELVQEIEAQGYASPLIYQCDMTDPEQVNGLIKFIKKEVGIIDVLINNAGVLGNSKPFLLTPDQEWWFTLNTNIACVVNTCRAVLPMMIARKKGVIVNLTSLSGQKGNPGQSAYSASKAAIVSFSKALHKEMGPLGIKINCISPGLIETDMTKDINPAYFQTRLANSPLKRMGKPEEVANLIAYMADEAPSYLIVQEITIDGGIGV